MRRRRTTGRTGVALAAVLLFFMCKVVKESNPTDLATSVSDLEITTEITGWTSDSFMVYNSVDELAESYFNGDAYNYTGLGESAIQSFANQSRWSLFICAMDLVTDAQCTSNYTTQKTENAAAFSQTALPSFDENSAVLFQTGADFIAYGRFGRFLFWMYLGGPPDAQTASGIVDQFFGIYKSKILG